MGRVSVRKYSALTNECTSLRAPITLRHLPALLPEPLERGIIIMVRRLASEGGWLVSGATTVRRHDISIFPAICPLIAEAPLPQ